MNMPNLVSRFHGPVVLVPTLLALAALLPACGSPENTVPDTPPADTATSQEMDTTAATGDTAESAEMAADADADAAPAEVTGSIEPPAEPDAGKLPEVESVDTDQFAEIVNATTGKATVLNIWATWCGPCVHEMPDLVKFYNATDRDEVAFISLSIDDVGEISGAIPDFQRDHDIPFPIYVMNERDIEGLVKALRGQFEGVIPVTYFYDREGKLVETVLGAITLAELHEKIQPLLASDTSS